MSKLGDFKPGSFHAKSPKIRKISRVTISDFDENWLKCSSTYMMATCKKVLSSGDKFYFYSHIYTGGGLSYFLLTMSNLNDCLF